MEDPIMEDLASSLNSSDEKYKFKDASSYYIKPKQYVYREIRRNRLEYSENAKYIKEIEDNISWHIGSEQQGNKGIDWFK